MKQGRRFTDMFRGIRKTTKAIPFVLAFALSLTSISWGAEEGADGRARSGAVVSYAADKADIPDSNLRKGINVYLAARGTSRATDAEISKVELAGITEISLNRMGIEDITGLENCTGIRRLELNENLIEDIGPLSRLNSLTHLYLNDNRIYNFSPIAGIANTSYLRVQAMHQDATGERLRRTSENLEFHAQMSYRAGAPFRVPDLKPPNANGTYFPSSGLITYGPIKTTDDMTVSYEFSLTENTSSGAGREVYLGGKITHAVFVPWCAAAFDAGAGALTGDRDRLAVIEGYPLGWLPGAVRTGYTLTGWEDEGGGTVTESAIITTDTSIRAVWTANEYTLSLDLNGGDEVSPSAITVTYDREVGPLPLPQRKGYTFTGWRQRPDGGPAVTEGAVWQSVTDRTVHASWSANIYTVFFDPQGGSLVPGPGYKIVIYDDIYGELPTPAYKGKVFEGWYTSPYGGLRIDAADDVKTDCDQTLYARYAEVDRASLRPVGVNEWVRFDEHRYRFDKNGVMLTGLRKVGKHYYYFDSAGRLLTNGKVRLSGYTLKADKNGKITNMPRPNRTTVTNVSKKGKRISVKWKKLIGVSGYHVQYALDRDFTKEIGVRTVKGGKTLEKTVKRLARGKRYYVRVRGYFIIDGLKVPGKYSRAVRSGR
jgi:uncharacterized repeat protein (TIGR02543 family)